MKAQWFTSFLKRFDDFLHRWPRPLRRKEPMTTKTLMTLAEFDLLPEQLKGEYCELLKGELLVTPSPTYYHQEICAALLERLRAYCREYGGAANFQTDWNLSDDTVLCPDVYYMSPSTLPHINKRRRNAGAPDLCIEVVSPSDTREEMIRKAAAYLDAGAQAVWAIYPAAGTAWIYHPGGGNPELVDKEGELTNATLLPGFSVKLTDILGQE